LLSMCCYISLHPLHRPSSLPRRSSDRSAVSPPAGLSPSHRAPSSITWGSRRLGPGGDHEYLCHSRCRCGATPPLEPESGLIRARSEEHTSELQSRFDLVCRLLLEKKKS